MAIRRLPESTQRFLAVEMAVALENTGDAHCVLRSMHMSVLDSTGRVLWDSKPTYGRLVRSSERGWYPKNQNIDARRCLTASLHFSNALPAETTDAFGDGCHIEIAMEATGQVTQRVRLAVDWATARDKQITVIDPVPI